VVFGDESRFFQAAVCRGLSRWTIRLTSDSQRSNAILDEDPRKSRGRNGRHKASKKSCHPLPTSATFCTLGALAQEAQIPAWPGFTIVQAASAAVYQRNDACTKPDAAPFGQRGSGRNMFIALMWHGSKGGYGSGWLNCTLLLNDAKIRHGSTSVYTGERGGVSPLMTRPSVMPGEQGVADAQPVHSLAMTRPCVMPGEQGAHAPRSPGKWLSGARQLVCQDGGGQRPDTATGPDRLTEVFLSSCNAAPRSGMLSRRC
jgi:hypothetical protein